jgi:phenylalanyl-tRNA synthetase beta chain
VLGVEFSAKQLRGLLEPLGFEVRKGKKKGGALQVRVPGFRSYDVTREIDLIEEVARAHGYDSFPSELSGSRPGTVPDHPLFLLEDTLRDRLVARGLFEAHTPAFVGAAQGEVRLRNPLSAEEAYLRTSVLPSLLRRVEHNWSRGTHDVRLFELATSFARADTDAGVAARVHEEPRLAAVVTGRTRPVHFSGAGEPYGLWDLRGVLEDAVRAAWPDGQVTPGAPPGRGVTPSEGFTVTAGGAMVGWGGRIESTAVDAPPWADPVYGFELRLPDEPRAPSPPKYRTIPPFPAVERDLALVVGDGVAAAAVEAAIRARGGELLREVSLFDLYRGKGVPEGHRSLAYRLRFVSPDRTLTDDEIERAVQRVVEHLAGSLGVERRA